jgi:hypothetical protein
VTPTNALATQDRWQRAMYSKTDHCVKPSGRTSGQMVSTYRTNWWSRQSRYAEDSGVHPTSGIDCEALRKDIWPNGVNLQDQLYGERDWLA